MDEKVGTALLVGLERSYLSPVPLRLAARSKAEDPALFYGNAKPTRAATQLALDNELIEESGTMVPVGKKGKEETGYRLTEEGQRILVDERAMGAVLRGLISSIKEAHAELVEARTKLEGAERNIGHLGDLVDSLKERVSADFKETLQSLANEDALSLSIQRTDPADAKKLVVSMLARHSRYATFPGIRIDALFGSISVEAPGLDRETFHQILIDLRKAKRIKIGRTKNPKEFAPGILIEENGKKLGIIHPLKR